MIGRRFAHYEVLEKLGAGGMGEVYRAKDLSLGREIAVKFLPTRFAADPKRLVRFEQEARAASSLNHPNIVTIHEIGQADGQPYIVMELIRGRTLRELLLGRPLLTRRALELAAQAAEGLAKAHAAGIVHRDLKPENLMLTDDGFVKILDFGLAKLMAPDSDAGPDPDVSAASEADTQSLRVVALPGGGSPATPDTAAGTVIGTVNYMSPEQARGRPVDFRSDQFACGAILYEMATGRCPFERPTAVQTLGAIVESDPEPIASLNPDAPPPLRWIVARCLAKDPTDRYASTLDLARELRQVHDKLDEVSGSPSTPVVSAVIPARGRRLWAGLAIGLAAALAWLSPPPGQWLKRLSNQALPVQRQLAVLGFTDSGGDTALFGEGLADLVSSKLSQLEPFADSLWVVPAADVRAAGVDSAAAARRAFGANLVVTGRIERHGDRLRLTANLIDASTQRPLREASLEAPAHDLPAWQDGVVDRVVDMLDLDLGPKASKVLRAGGTRVATAYELYLKGRVALQRFDNPESLERAISAFQQALQQDPSYALAYAGMGEAQWRRYQMTKDAASVELAQKACQRAAELNDLLAPVHVTLGLLHAETGQNEEALGDFGRALALDPMSSEALREKALSYERLGRLADAETTLKRAIEVKPSYWAGYNSLGGYLFRRGRYPEAIEAFQKVIALTPDNEVAYSNLGGIFVLMERYAEAEVALGRALQLHADPDALSNLGTCQYFQGRYAAAARTFEAVVKQRDTDATLWRNLAAAYYWSPGERDKAASAYRRSVALAKRDLELDPHDAVTLAYVADAYAMLGEGAAARRFAGEALAAAAGDVNVLFVVGQLYEQLGDRKRALELIGRALAAGYSASQIERTPALARLRADPGFRQALEQSRQGGR